MRVTSWGVSCIGHSEWNACDILRCVLRVTAWVVLATRVSHSLPCGGPAPDPLPSDAARSRLVLGAVRHAGRYCGTCCCTGEGPILTGGGLWDPDGATSRGLSRGNSRRPAIVAAFARLRQLHGLPAIPQYTLVGCSCLAPAWIPGDAA
eukprot:jgi/Botrbrau1/17871/Bobra.0845s0004.1